MKMEVKKRGEIGGQPALYIFLLIIFTFILLIGYNFVKDMGEKREKTTLIFFKSELAGDIGSVDYGSVKIETYEVPTGIDKICFSEPKNTNPLTCPDCPNADGDPIVANAISDKTKENVFLISGYVPETMKVEEITIGCCEFVCVNVTHGKVKLMLEGKGEKTLIKNV